MDRGPAKRSVSPRSRGTLALAALAVLAAEAPAAETWLHPVLPQAVMKAAPSPSRRGARPSRPAPAAPSWPFPTALSGESSFVELAAGDRYPEPESAVAPERIERSFVRLGSARPMPLTSATLDGARTRLEATWAGQGLATLGVVLAHEARTVEPGAFESFLREAGASAALAERTRRKETKKVAKVVETRSARAFAGIVAPPRSAAPVDPAAGHDEPLGLPLEIVAGAPPLALRAGTSLTATVLLDGKPAPGALLRAYAPGSGMPVAVVADEQGSVVLPLEADGRLLLATAAVRRTEKADRARGEAWKKADWEVQRTTLELLVLPRPPAPAPTATPKGKRPTPRAKPR